eukprot:PITA_04472
MKTPMEAFSGKQPDVSHFQILESSVYCHVRKYAQKKLDPIAELGILVGYTDTPHNYRVHLPTNQRTVVCRDLKFDEQKAMRVSLERELKLHVEEELSVPNEEKPQIDVEKLHVDDPGVETSTHAKTSRDGRKRSREVDRLMLDAQENVGQPSSQRRQRRLPERYTGYMALFGECVESEPSSFEEAVQQPIWVDAMVEEYNSIIQNSVWDVVPRPQDKSVVEGIDYNETFAPVAKYSSIRLMLALSAQMGWKIHQMDMKTTFLNGKIEEEVYIE